MCAFCRTFKIGIVRVQELWNGETGARFLASDGRLPGDASPMRPRCRETARTSGSETETFGSETSETTRASHRMIDGDEILGVFLETN